MIDINIPAGTDKRLADCLRGMAVKANQEIALREKEITALKKRIEALEGRS